MDPVVFQPQSQFGLGQQKLGFEDQGTFGQKTILPGLEILNQANEITILHKRITCVESNY